MDHETMIRVGERARRAQAAAQELRGTRGAQAGKLLSRESRMEADAAWIEARIEREHSRAVAAAVHV